MSKRLEDQLEVTADVAEEEGEAGAATYLRMMARDPEREIGLQVDEAIDVIRADYYAHVTFLADMVIDEATADYIETNEQLQTFFDESIQGDGWVIQSHLAKRVLLVSKNSDAYMEDPGLVNLNATAIMDMANAALRVDVREQIIDTVGEFELNEILEYLEEEDEEDEE